MAALMSVRFVRFVRRAAWQLTRWAQRPGAGPGLAALCVLLLLAAALFWHRSGRELEAATAARAKQVAQLRPAATAGGAPDAVRQFLAGLPAADDAAAVVQVLFDQAEREGLRLPRGNYRLQPEPATQLMRYRISLPVRGEAQRVQRFVQAALVAVPTLAVESIHFKREGVAGLVVEARIEWVLFVRAVANAPTLASSDGRGRP